MEKNNCCPEEAVKNYAEKLKVCGHPIRLQLLCIIEKGDSCVTELWKCLEQPQPVISQHLAVLKEKGIVSSVVKGNKRIYSIKDTFVQRVIRSLDFCISEDSTSTEAKKKTGTREDIEKRNDPSLTA